MKKIFLTLICFLALSNAVFAETISFNVVTHKIHKLTCRYANCKNCVKMDRQKAVQQGGIPCKVCGG